MVTCTRSFDVTSPWGGPCSHGDISETIKRVTTAAGDVLQTISAGPAAQVVLQSFFVLDDVQMTAAGTENVSQSHVILMIMVHRY